ncbi:RING finger protein 207-like [Saccostrea echinata]|uniref:RING finger protein 207-like n=1 Tax=Saccostrea echinata TaxID=191078 RepID=UPI002A7F0622|nr:RING finger protein 207-like [Saccostrea echinata]
MFQVLSLLKIPGTAQHYLECQSEECKRNCEFYCNTCHLQLCKQCRDEHLRAQENKNHDVVIYQERTRKPPLQKCEIHPTKDTDMLCEECQVSLCSKCATSQDHKGHSFTDLEKIHAENLALWQVEIDKICEYFMPTSQSLQNEVRDDAKEIKKIMNNMRESLIVDADSLRSFVDAVVTRNMKQIDQIENSLLKDIETQEDTFTNYITYLNDLVKEFN